MKKTFLYTFIFCLFSPILQAKEELIITGSGISDSENLPVSLTPIKENNEIIIDPKPIKNTTKNNSSSEIDKIKKSEDFFSDIKKLANSPTFEYQGQVYEKNQIVEVEGGKIVLTPIENESKKTKKILPPGFENISSDVEWIDYEDFLAKQKQTPKQNDKSINDNINRPEGYFKSETPKDYIDDFFDNNIVNEVKDKEKIKKSMDDIVNSYNSKPKDDIKKIENKKTLNQTPIKPAFSTNKDKKEIEKGFQNVLDIYKNPERKETLGFLSNDIINSTPKAIRNHSIPENLKGKEAYIRIFKESNSLELYLLDHGKYKLVNTYTICTFSGGLGPKKRQGDEKSPEGFYAFKSSDFNPYSQYHKSIDLGFPNEYDRSHGYNGSLLMVHGGCKSIGCYAMTDKYIEEIYQFAQAALNNGQKNIQVDIFPFKMTDDNMKKHKNNENYEFWKNIKTGYDIFEKTGKPAKVSVENKKYVFR